MFYAPIRRLTCTILPVLAHTPLSFTTLFIPSYAWAFGPLCTVFSSSHFPAFYFPYAPLPSLTVHSTFPFLLCRNTSVPHSHKRWQSQARYGDYRQNDAVPVLERAAWTTHNGGGEYCFVFMFAKVFIHEADCDVDCFVRSPVRSTRYDCIRIFSDAINLT